MKTGAHISPIANRKSRAMDVPMQIIAFLVNYGSLPRNMTTFSAKKYAGSMWVGTKRIATGSFHPNQIVTTFEAFTCGSSGTTIPSKVLIHN
jgi:hypothetical protein